MTAGDDQTAYGLCREPQSARRAVIASGYDLAHDPLHVAKGVCLHPEDRQTVQHRSRDSLQRIRGEDEPGLRHVYRESHEGVCEHLCPLGLQQIQKGRIRPSVHIARADLVQLVEDDRRCKASRLDEGVQYQAERRRPPALVRPDQLEGRILAGEAYDRIASFREGGGKACRKTRLTASGRPDQEYRPWCTGGHYGGPHRIEEEPLESIKALMT